MRKNNYGTYHLLNPEDDSIYAYERILENKKILIVCNFYEHEKEFSYEMSKNSKAEILISNYNNSSLDLKKIKLRSYEAIMYEVKEGKV